MLTVPGFASIGWLTHGFGERDSLYPAGLTTVKQIHSCIVAEAGEKVAEADALVSNQPGVVVAIRTADCVPILLVDVRRRAVASIHAGWRGTACNIVSESVRTLTTRYGSRPEDIRAAIGPAIGYCCYEVSEDVAQRFHIWTRQGDALGPQTRNRLDLAAINEAQLREAGVADVWQAGLCTFCEAGRFFSYRREKEEAGRMLSFIGVLPDGVLPA